MVMYPSIYLPVAAAKRTRRPAIRILSLITPVHGHQSQMAARAPTDVIIHNARDATATHCCKLFCYCIEIDYCIRWLGMVILSGRPTLLFLLLCISQLYSSNIYLKLHRLLWSIQGIFLLRISNLIFYSFWNTIYYDKKSYFIDIFIIL